MPPTDGRQARDERRSRAVAVMAGGRDAYDVLRLAVGFAIVAAYVSSMSATLIIEGYSTPVEVHAAMVGLATWLFGPQIGGRRNSRDGDG